MPSARARITGPAGAGALLISAAVLAGCTTTQETAARLRLNSDRIVAASNGTRVTRNARTVTVKAISVVRGHHRSATIVAVSNPSPHALSDLPISVGYTLGARRVYLNASSSLGYFNAHLPLIAAHQTINWVFSSAHAIPAGAQLFANIGATPSVPVGTITAVPDLSVRATGVSASDVKLAIDNTSGLPQYQLQVYYVGQRGRRVVTAGNMTVAYIGSGSTQTVQIRPAGAAAGAAVRIEALPTTFK